MLGVLCIIECPGQLIREGFFEIAFVVDTHLPRFEAVGYVLPHFDAPTHVVFVCPRRSSFKRLLRSAILSS